MELVQQWGITNQMSQKKEKIWKVNLVILMKLQMPPQASHDWWRCGFFSRQPSALLYLKNDQRGATFYHYQKTKTPKTETCIKEDMTILMLK